ncbi:repressor activator protein 1 [Trypanosoma grayi]|uniref:repressor activator protein 1 n=1 Tax=Trypanosoma grayi TaxID=71804 RepID=UPI0004F4221F|nr:repressor activator protein 1 [Trypanosoma grayi]KEG12584.1 repressor activator protein 1 [Trypanosoma grayi]
MNDNTPGGSPMWCGVRFFVDADVLLTFDAVKLTDMDGRPGQPQRRIALVEGKALPVTSYSGASLFLKALKATGNPVVVVSPWKPEKTTSLLRLFGWDTLYEVRAVHPEPGHEQLLLSCVGCGLEEYSSAVVVSASRAAWHASLWSQVVEVQHEAERPSSSLALLRALSCCLRIAECRVRLPHTAVSSCVALCRARLFARYRFCLAPEVVEQSSVAMLINGHGGYLVTNCEDATHYVVGDRGDALSCTLQKPRLSPADGDDASSSASNTPSASTAENGTDSTASEEGSAASEESDEEKWQGENEEDDGGVVSPSVAANEVASFPAETSGNGGNPLPLLSAANGRHEAEARGEHARGSATATTVTTKWLQDCVDGLLVYPPQVAHSTDDTSQWNTSALLLAVLLPPPDAEPLTLSRFNSIAEAYKFCPFESSQATGHVDIAAVLQKQWGAALHVEVKDEELLLSRPSIDPNEGGLELERHLAFIAEQFSVAWAAALRDRRLHNTLESGTQTAVPITATSWTNTEATSLVGEGATTDPPSQGRTILMRALGPTEWAKEVDASSMTHHTLRTTEHSVSLEPLSELALVSEPPSNCDSPPVVNEVDTGRDEKRSVLGQRTHDDVAQLPAADAGTRAEDDEGEFVMCFIPTESLGADQEALDKDALLRHPPFRNYPMKLTIDKRGIHCLFVTAFDAKRFRQEGYAEVHSRFLPIMPEYDDEATSAPGSRKRRRSRSPVTKRPSSSSTRSARKETSSGSYGSHNHRNATDTSRALAGASNAELSKSDLELLGEIGATYDFALQQVDVVERYALNELADPVFRKQQHQLLRVVAKLKSVRARTV